MAVTWGLRFPFLGHVTELLQCALLQLTTPPDVHLEDGHLIAMYNVCVFIH